MLVLLAEEAGRRRADQPELEIKLKLRRFGSSAFAWYRSPLPRFLLDLEPPHHANHFPSLSHADCSWKHLEPPPPEAAPPRDLIAGEPGHSDDRLHHHPNGDITLTPSLPSVCLTMHGNVTGEPRHHLAGG